MRGGRGGRGRAAAAWGRESKAPEGRANETPAWHEFQGQRSLKFSKRPELTFLHRRHADGPPGTGRRSGSANGTIMSLHLIPVRTAIIKENPRALVRPQGKGRPGTLLVGM